MSGDYIDRDPEAILEYANSVKSYYEKTGSLIFAANSAVQCYLDELNDKCRELGDKFDNQVKAISSQLESYNELSSQLERKAQLLIEAEQSIHF